MPAQTAVITRALVSAARQGFNPRDSHPVQSAAWIKAWARREARNAEREARQGQG